MFEVFRIRCSKLTGFSVRCSPDYADRLGPCTWTIREWIKKYQATGELPAAGQVVPEAEEMKRLRKQIKQLELENEILKKAAAYFAKDIL